MAIEDSAPGNASRNIVKSAAAFRTISEVAEDLDVLPHVLRFWETKFSQVRPMKRAGGRRYYRPEDVALLRQIRGLLHKDGYTIKGVQRLLRDGGGKLPTAESTPFQEALIADRSAEVMQSGNPKPVDRIELIEILDELKELRRMLTDARGC